jgi:hypothetical protein
MGSAELSRDLYYFVIAEFGLVTVMRQRQSKPLTNNHRRVTC